MHGGPPQTGDVEELTLNLEQVKEANALLVKENEELKQKVECFVEHKEALLFQILLVSLSLVQFLRGQSRKECVLFMG